MIQSKDMLALMIRTIRLHKIEIQMIKSTPLPINVQNELQSQLQKYSHLEQESLIVASQRGWNLQNQTPFMRDIFHIIVHTRPMFGGIRSKTFTEIVQKTFHEFNTGLNRLRQSSCFDEHINILSQKLLDCEYASIQNLQEFI